MRFALALIALASLAAAGSARLFAGVDDTTVSTRFTDLAGFPNVTWTNGNTGTQVWGAAYDAATDTLYTNNGSTLQKWAGPSFTSFTTIGVITVNAATSSVTGLAFGNGKLYAYRSVTAPGIYEINTVDATATLVWAVSSVDWGGIDFNPANGKFYVSNDSTAGTGRGIYEIDLALQTSTKIANYPGTENDIDGLAVGDGNIYLVDDDNTTLPVASGGTFYRYNLAQGTNGTYDNFPAPWTSSEVFSGGTWIGGAAPNFSGTITFSGRNAVISPVNFQWLDAGGNIIETISGNVTPAGEYSVKGPTVVGDYRLSIKPGSFLRKNSASINTATSQSGINFVLINGDVNGDNEVGPADFSLLSAAFGSFLGDPNYSAAADLNADEEVGPADFSILAASFGEFGD